MRLFSFSAGGVLGLVLLGAEAVRAIPTDLQGRRPLTASVDVTRYKSLLEESFVSHIDITITLNTLVTNYVSVSFDAQNPVPVDVTVTRISAIAGINNASYVSFDQEFTNFTLPASGAGSSGTFSNVFLTQGAIATLNIIPQGSLDIQNANISLSVSGYGPLELTGVTQSNVSTSYLINLSK